jgi:hypothetical protein
METVQVLIIAALVVLVVVRRFAGQPLTTRRLLLVPLLPPGFGLYRRTARAAAGMAAEDLDRCGSARLCR